MKPGFALSLSFEGISLLQRAAGGWRSVGEVSLEAADLVGDLGGLRDKAKAFGPDELRCKIIIPNEQIRYLSVETGSFGGEARLALIRSALQGATPYPVEDLVFDLAVDEAITHVAAVARETLAEAEAFAVEHGFCPLSFVATPGDNGFLGEPFFGASAHAATLPGEPTIEADGIAVVVIGPAIRRAVDAVLDPEPAESPAPKREAAPVTGGFASRRKPGSAQAAPEPKPESKPEPASSPTLGGATRDAPLPTADGPAPVEFQSVKSQSGTDDGPDVGAGTTSPVSEPISVTAPSLDVPTTADTGADENPAQASAEVPAETPTKAPVEAPAASDSGGFLSRRKKAESSQPVPLVAPIPPAPAPIGEPKPAAHPELMAVSRPSLPGFIGTNAPSSPEDEATRLTVFGARDQAKVGGKPRHLGLILSAVLLLFLAAVAAWASIYLENGVAGLFRAAPVETERADVPQVPANNTAPDGEPALVAASPEIDQPAGEEPTTLALLPPADLDVPSLPAPRRLAQPDQPAVPDLTDTDSAVLDALRQTDLPEDLAEPPGVDDPVDDPGTEIASVPTGDQAAPLAQDPATELAPQVGTDQEQENLAAVTYAATGILQRAPQASETPSIIGLDDLYVASIDRTDLSQDAVALPPVASLITDRALGSVSSPFAAGTDFSLDFRGLVEASVEGTLNPGGVMVFLGRPSVVPPAIPARLATGTEIQAAPAQLVGLRPRLRPRDLEERFERTNLGGLTRQELSGLRPKARPESLQEQAKPDGAPTAQAVVASRIPPPRPANFADIVSAAVRPPSPDESQGSAASTTAAAAPTAAPSGGTTTTAAAAVATAAPRSTVLNIPSSASVARQATLRHEINLRRVNLIGVYGTPSNRRALVRLPSGRYKKVKVGDSVDGGRVVAIGDSELRYQKSGRNLTLKIPSS